MTAKPKKQPAPAAETVKLNVQRIRVNAQGYDRGGSYWGAGPDVFILTTSNGGEEFTLRARDVKEARAKAAAEMQRKPGAPRAKEPIGGASPHKSHIEMNWRNHITGETIRLRITHERDYLHTGSDHIEIESIAPARAPLPITETGYRSHFLSAQDIERSGGAESFVTHWLDGTATSKPWIRSQQAKAQGDLFQWAKARAEVEKRMRKKPSRPPEAKPRGKHRGRAPK